MSPQTLDLPLKGKHGSEGSAAPRHKWEKERGVGRGEGNEGRHFVDISLRRRFADKMTGSQQRRQLHSSDESSVKLPVMEMSSQRTSC